MACRSCQLQIEATLCQVCRYLSEMLHPEKPVTCRNCRGPITNPAKTGSLCQRRLCQLCRVLLQVVRGNQWLASAHAEWVRENFVLARRKQEMLGQGGGQSERQERDGSAQPDGEGNL